MTKPRALGSCYVCGKLVWGYNAPHDATTTYKKGGALRDMNGLRHGKCRPSGPGFGSPSGVNVTDA